MVYFLGEWTDRHHLMKDRSGQKGVLGGSLSYG